MFMFGGVSTGSGTADMRVYNDLWQYRYDVNEWKQVRHVVALTHPALRSPRDTHMHPTPQLTTAVRPTPRLSHAGAIVFNPPAAATARRLRQSTPSHAPGTTIQLPSHELSMEPGSRVDSMHTALQRHRHTATPAPAPAPAAPASRTSRAQQLAQQLAPATMQPPPQVEAARHLSTAGMPAPACSLTQTFADGATAGWSNDVTHYRSGSSMDP